MAQLTVARPSRICTGFLTQMVLGRLHQRGVRSPLPGGPRRSARIQVGLHEVLRRQGPADDDDRGLGQARGLDLVGDVGEGAAQDQFLGLGDLRADDDRAVGPVVGTELIGQPPGVSDRQVQDEGGIGRGAR